MHGAVTFYGNENYRDTKHWAEQIIGHSLQDSEIPGSPCCAPPPPKWLIILIPRATFMKVRASFTVMSIIEVPDLKEKQEDSIRWFLRSMHVSFSVFLPLLTPHRSS